MSKFRFFEDKPLSQVNTSAAIIPQHTNDIIPENNHSGAQCRYRCEQVNLIKVNDIPTMHSTIRTEYLTEIDLKQQKAKVSIQDYTQELSDEGMALALEMVRYIETIKGNVRFKLSGNGKISDISNMTELRSNWENFRDNVLPGLEMFRELKSLNMQAAKDIIYYGDLEFSDSRILINQYEKNLFFHMLFDEYMTNTSVNPLGDSIMFISQIFQNITLKLNREPFLAAENEQTATYRKVGVLDKALIDEGELKRQYNQLYLPLVKYNYTSFNYEYILEYTIDKKTNLLLDGNVSIIESIKNNYESICSFQIKQVKL